MPDASAKSRGGEAEIADYVRCRRMYRLRGHKPEPGERREITHDNVLHGGEAEHQSLTLTVFGQQCDAERACLPDGIRPCHLFAAHGKATTRFRLEPCQRP